MIGSGVASLAVARGELEEIHRLHAAAGRAVAEDALHRHRGGNCCRLRRRSDGWRSSS